MGWLVFLFCVLKGGRCGQVYVPSSGSNPPGRQVVSLSLIAEREEFELLVFSNLCILFLLRATALLLSVSHLVLVTRNACHMSGSLDWIDQSLHAAEDHMVVLREAALASEPERILFGDDAQREQAIWGKNLKQHKLQSKIQTMKKLLHSNADLVIRTKIDISVSHPWLYSGQNVFKIIFWNAPSSSGPIIQSNQHCSHKEA